MKKIIWFVEFCVEASKKINANKNTTTTTTTKLRIK